MKNLLGKDDVISIDGLMDLSNAIDKHNADVLSPYAQKDIDLCVAALSEYEGFDF